MEKINLLSLYAGLVIGGVFCGYALCRSREAPKLNQLIIVILSSAAVAVGINLGYLSLTLEDTFLGKLAEDRYHSGCIGCCLDLWRNAIINI